jgi:uncharacterized membrane protein YcaP (DUF421 family)
MQTDFEPFDWFRIFVGEAPLAYYGELAMKILIVFAVLVVVMRILGKTGRDHLSPLQQMLLIALGSSAGDVMLYHDVPLGHAALILLGVSGIAVFVEFLTTKSRVVRDAIDSKPVLLVLDGTVLRERLHAQRINERELHAAIREAGGRAMAQVQLAVLEVTGKISVFLDEETPPAEEDLLDCLRAQARADEAGGAGPPAPEPAGS